MRKNLRAILAGIGGLLLPHTQSSAQISVLQDYKNYSSAPIGTFQGINFREAGFSGMYPIAGTKGTEFWVCSDRGVNVDAANANPSGCTPTYDKIYGFPGYAPKIHRVRIKGDSVQILQTITMKRPDGTNATGIINPVGFGSTAAEQASTDTVLNCANFSSKIAPKDAWGIDAEGIVVDRDGYFWICEEGGPTIWKLNQNGVVVKRYTPFANLTGAHPIDVQIDTAFKYRKNNRGFEGIALAPNGKIYAMIQSPLLYPTKTVGENSRVHRLLEIDPLTNATRMFVYLNDGIIGTGSNQIRLRDWKIGDLTAINDTTFLVLEAGLRGTTDIKRMYRISLNGATVVNSGLYGGVTLEALVDSTGLAANSIVPLQKTLGMDLLANGWNPMLDKAEGVAIIDDSTLVIGNDNDYGQYSPLENGIATATTNLSHIVKYRLSGANKLNNYHAVATNISSGITGPSSSKTPYVTPIAPGAWAVSILTASDVIGGYKMCGTPDGLGAFDNGDGTFTVVMNHEFGNTAGAVRAHGSVGAFVSKWVINKSDLSVVSGSDLTRNINLWNPTTSSYITYNAAFPSAAAALNRFCSADLPAVSAFYNSATGKGTQERIFMNGEEAGNEGRAFGHVITGPNAGKSYELPWLGKYSWENSVASPTGSDTTVVIGMDDATPGQVYVYVGTKTTSGTDVDKAGLNNGKVYGVAVSGLATEVSASVPSAGTPFSLTDLGYVQNSTGLALNNASNSAGVTTFLRPEDGAWDPQNRNDFYFATTNAFASPSRLWKLHFTDPANPALGGVITAVLDGTEGQKMLDNLTIDNYGHILLVEDVGGNAHLGKTWQYDIATDVLVQVASHDSTRFLAGSANFLTIDEETSGIIDMENILGPGMFLMVDEAHYGVAGEAVEGGQLLAFFNPASFNAVREINISGNGNSIVDGSLTASVTNNTDFGSVSTGGSRVKNFVISNDGAANLVISGISFSGINAGEFSLVSAPSFPLTVAAGTAYAVSVNFTPMAGGSRSAAISIASNDIDEAIFNYALVGNGIDSPEVNLQGNGVNIINGDMTPGVSNNTDFGNVNVISSTTRTFVIQNVGVGNLVVSAINFTGTHASDFSLVGAPSFPLTVATASSYTVTVQFAPAASGARSASIEIVNTDDNEGSYSFALAGTGLALPEIVVKGNAVAITDGDLTAGTANNTDFGSVALGGSLTRTFTVINTGMDDLRVSAVSFTGAHAADFSLVSSPSFPLNIHGGDSLVLTAKFAPGAIGIRTAVINIASNDADESTFDFALQGTATGLPEISIQGNSANIADGDVTAGTANNTDFGNVHTGSDVTKSFTIQNTGAGALTVSNISFSGANASEFTLSGSLAFPVSIPASGNQSFNVKFAPTAVGGRAATITIVNTDGDEANYDFALQGTGVNSVGVDDVNDAASFRVYPNPMGNTATIAVNLVGDSHMLVNILDMQGREVLQVLDAQMAAGQHLLPLNTAQLANGIYFLKVSDGVSSTIVKMVVMH